MRLTNDDVQEILHLLDSAYIDEMHLETQRLKLTLRRDGDGEWARAEQVLATPCLLKPVPGVKVAAAPRGSAKPASPDVDGLVSVRTPLLGTFYRAPKPGSPPFVEVGSRVEKDTVIAIVETMKLMNSVYAGTSGTIAEICLDDAEFADHDAVLMRITPEEP